MTATSPGARLLYRLRRAQGRTQAGLGAAAGVSVRTIRGLERGEIDRPQVATLQQLALALGLSVQAEAEFLHAWSTPGRTNLHELVDGADLSEAERIDTIVRAHLSGFRTIHQTAHVFVDARRRIQRSTYEFSIQAVEDGLDQVANVMHGDQAARARDMRMVAAVGCAPARRWDFPESNALVQMVELPHPLERGERHAYSFEIVSDHVDGLADSDGFTRGSLNTVRSLVVSVQFEVPPATLEHLVRRPQGGYELLGPRSLDEDHRAVLVLEDEEPTGHGFVWSW